MKEFVLISGNRNHPHATPVLNGSGRAGPGEKVRPMAEKAITHHTLVPQLFKQEYTKMTAVLCRHFGLQHIETAEDIASETFLKAMETWALQGIPENPAAWLYTVAKNKTRDLLKRQGIFETRVKTAIRRETVQPETDIDFSAPAIADSQLAMLFAVCNPSVSAEAQVCLALQVLCGFSMEEIAGAFLSKTATIKKRLSRARASLRNDHFRLAPLQEESIRLRLDTVLTTLYLLFNEGYFSASASQPVRKELCSEAIRLTHVLTGKPLTNTPQVNALLALMCFQASRLDARTSESGEAVLFEQQDKNLWNRELIEKGNSYLANACRNNNISRYHLEAAIAYWHCAGKGDEKWTHILQLYNQLMQVAGTPATALNRVFAFAKVHGHTAAIHEAEQLQLTGLSYYHSLLGYLYAPASPEKAIAHYRQAIGLIRSPSGKKTLSRELERLQEGLNH